jgi:hypothetical protein
MSSQPHPGAVGPRASTQNGPGFGIQPFAPAQRHTACDLAQFGFADISARPEPALPVGTRKLE